jgi:hypothetical protein
MKNEGSEDSFPNITRRAAILAAGIAAHAIVGTRANAQQGGVNRDKEWTTNENAIPADNTEAARQMQAIVGIVQTYKNKGPNIAPQDREALMTQMYKAAVQYGSYFKHHPPGLATLSTSLVRRFEADVNALDTSGMQKSDIDAAKRQLLDAYVARVVEIKMMEQWFGEVDDAIVSLFVQGYYCGYFGICPLDS